MSFELKVVTPTLVMLGRHAGISVEQMTDALDRGTSVDDLLQLIAQHLLAKGKPVIHVEE